MKGPNGLPSHMTPVRIRPKNLKPNQYTISLMEDGLRSGLLNQQEVYSIQNRLMIILQSLIARYTQGESSSVAAETAESLLSSIMYAIDAYMQSIEHPDQAITCLKTGSLQKIYEAGVERVRQCFEDTKQLYREVRRNKLDIPVDAYNMTIDESLPVFFKKYEIVFDAHQTMASIDYPLAIDDMRVQGVFYMKQYLEHLKIETRFCRMFSQADLRELLVNFGRVCRFDYRIELFNIFELVLNNAIFSMLSGAGAHQLQISTASFERLNRLLSETDPSQVSSMIQEAIHRLLQERQICDPSLADYMNRCKKEVIQRIVHAAKHNSLEAVIITRQEETMKPIAFSVSAEDRISDAELRLMLEEIRQLEDKEDKAKLIKSRLRSLHDFLDILESDCLYEDEYEALFETFGDIELAVLFKIVFYESIRNDRKHLLTIINDTEVNGSEWQTYFTHYLKSLSRNRLGSIELLIHHIDYQEITFH